MLDIGSSELLMIVIVAVVVIGPKDLPRALYKLGQIMGKARAMSRHFRTGLDAMVREAELEEMEKKWAAENKRIMEQYPQAEEEASAPEMEALPAPAVLPPVPSADAAHAPAAVEPPPCYVVDTPDQAVVDPLNSAAYDTTGNSGPAVTAARDSADGVKPKPVPTQVLAQPMLPLDGDAGVEGERPAKAAGKPA